MALRTAGWGESGPCPLWGLRELRACCTTVVSISSGGMGIAEHEELVFSCPSCVLLLIFSIECTYRNVHQRYYCGKCSTYFAISIQCFFLRNTNCFKKSLWKKRVYRAKTIWKWWRTLYLLFCFELGNRNLPPRSTVVSRWRSLFSSGANRDTEISTVPTETVSSNQYSKSVRCEGSWNWSKYSCLFCKLIRKDRAVAGIAFHVQRTFLPSKLNVRHLKSEIAAFSVKWLKCG